MPLIATRRKEKDSKENLVTLRGRPLQYLHEHWGVLPLLSQAGASFGCSEVTSEESEQPRTPGHSLVPTPQSRALVHKLGPWPSCGKPVQPRLNHCWSPVAPTTQSLLWCCFPFALFVRDQVPTNYQSGTRLHTSNNILLAASNFSQSRSLGVYSPIPHKHTLFPKSHIIAPVITPPRVASNSLTDELPPYPRHSHDT